MPHINRHLPHVKIENFEGPFDLLLELTASHRLDISTISLGQITDDFLHYIRAHVIDPLIKGDFLVVAATLLAMKIRKLLPTLEPDTEDQENIVAITDRLRIYELYREQALRLRSHWGKVRLLPAQYWSEHSDTKVLAPLAPILAEDIAVHMQAVIHGAPVPPMPTKHMVRTGRSLQQCLELWHSYLDTSSEVTFQDAMKTIDRSDIALSLLAALEMHRQGEISLQQKDIFSPLLVAKQS